MSHRTIYEDIRSVISLLESASGPMRFVKRDGPTTAPSRPDHALASLSAAQASEKGLLTSGTFGHTGSTSSRSAALATSLENRLRAKTDGLGSTLYKLTWKHWDLPSGRQICALRASVRRTSAKDCGSMGPCPTPMACDARGSAGEGQERIAEHSETERMGDTIGVGRQQQSNGRGSDGAGVGSTGREQKQSSKASGSTQRMVYTDDTGRSEGCEGSEAARQGRAALAANGTQRMADAEHEQHERCLSRPGQGSSTQSSGQAVKLAGLCTDNTAYPTNGFWRDADWLGCRDGKFRPVEPGTFPLVNGAAARVGRLRGYGNAIVAQVAQTFIEATQEW